MGFAELIIGRASARPGGSTHPAKLRTIHPASVLRDRRFRRDYMTEPKIRFEDGAGYERMMGVWSRLAGDIFLDWLAPRPGLRWIDVGCGNGAFTELLAARCAPAGISGDRSVRGTDRVCAGKAVGKRGRFSNGGCHGASLPGEQFRGGRHGARHLLRSRSCQGCRGDGAGRRGRAAPSRPMPGTSWAADFLPRQFRPRCARWG